MMRQLEINNVYELYDDVVTRVAIDIKTPDEVTDDPEFADYAEYLYDTIFPLTGVGHEDGNSAYFIESVDDLEPAINEEYGT